MASDSQSTPGGKNTCSIYCMSETMPCTEALSDMQRFELSEKAGVLGGKMVKGRFKGRPEQVNFCRLCGAKKHETKWCTVVTGKGLRRALGGTCYHCYRACTRHLLITRCVEAIQAVPGVQDIVRRTSDSLRAKELHDDCQCHLCSKAASAKWFFF